MRPLLHSISSRHPDIDVLSIDARKKPMIASSLGVRATPTLIGYSSGVERFRTTGRRTSAELEELFDSLLSESPPSRLGRTDVALRLGSGVLLTVLGLAAGPAWALLVTGLSLTLFGLATMPRMRR